MEESLFAESGGNPSPMRMILTIMMHESSHSIHPREGPPFVLLALSRLTHGFQCYGMITTTVGLGIRNAPE